MTKTKEELEARLEEISEVAEKRRWEYQGTNAGLYPSGSDWMTREEMAEMHEIKMCFHKVEPTRQELRDRVAEKRAKRRSDGHLIQLPRVDQSAKTVSSVIDDEPKKPLAKREG